MENLYPHGWQAYLAIGMVFLRLLGLFLLMPVFSHRSIPGTVKVLFALSLALALFPIVRTSLGPVPLSLGGIALLALRETAVGFLMGFGVYVTFEAIHLSAQFVGTQMGFGTAGLMDPETQSQASLLVPFYGWLALMVFLLCDMHHGVLRLFVLSYTATREMSGAGFGGAPMTAMLIGLTGKLFVIAVQMAAPFTLLCLACNAALGVLGRMLPQMNVLLFSFPVTILAGVLVLYLLAPEMLSSMEAVIGDMTGDLMGLLRTL